MARTIDQIAADLPQTGNTNPTRSFVTPTGPGLNMSDVMAFHQETAQFMAQVPNQFADTTAATGAQRSGLQNQLKFGLRGLDLQREGLGLDREQQAINRRNAIEAAINNALQRGIFNSGIRERNVDRAEEQADLQSARLDLRAKQINLSEEELRSSIKTALAALNANVAAQRRAQQAQIEAAQNDIRAQREIALIEWINQHGGTITNDTTFVAERPGAPF